MGPWVGLLRTWYYMLLRREAQASFLGIGGGESVHFGQETGKSGSAFDVII